MRLNFGLSGKRAVVVGAGLGIGRDTALSLAEVGASVMCVDVDAARAEKVAAEIGESGGRAATFVGDVTDRDVVEALGAETTSALTGVDVVIDIVGLAYNVGVLEAADHTWDANLRLNLFHNFLVTQTFARQMVEAGTGGAFVHIGSATGFLPHVGSTPYSAAKAGLISLVQSSAVELAPHGIRVNGVAPGVIDTPRRHQQFTADSIVASLRNVPMKRFGTTQEIANVAVFLASDLASYVSGQMYLVDGGAMAVGPFPSALDRPVQAPPPL